MRKLLAALVLSCAAIGGTPGLAQDRPPASATPIDPETLALAQQVVDIAYPPANRQAMYARVIDALMQQTRAAAFAATAGAPDAGTQQILDRYLERVRAETDRLLRDNSPALFAAYARGYARMFNRDELMQIRAFVATPTGAKYIQRSADLLADPDVAQANTTYMTTAFTMLHGLEAELREELIAYHRRQQANPPATRSPASRH